MIRWRRIAQEYPCLTCGAPPGAPCVTITGKARYEIHQWRSAQASANNWADPSEVSPGRDVGHSETSSPVRSGNASSSE